ncbi:protein of unknown function [Alcaligenes faecalis subsp. faecalis]|nr:protein of unknown function [Alcaligenes faecalis subsp. faecalis]
MTLRILGNDDHLLMMWQCLMKAVYLLSLLRKNGRLDRFLFLAVRNHIQHVPDTLTGGTPPSPIPKNRISVVPLHPFSPQKALSILLVPAPALPLAAAPGAPAAFGARNLRAWMGLGTSSLGMTYQTSLTEMPWTWSISLRFTM